MSYFLGFWASEFPAERLHRKQNGLDKEGRDKTSPGFLSKGMPPT
jgi:hypothetical protein